MKYLAFYDNYINRSQNRVYSPAAALKVEYLSESINKCGFKVDIISPVLTSGDKYCNGIKYNINEMTTVKLFPSWKSKFILTKVFRYFYFWVDFFLYLSLNIKTNETIIVYHSLSFVLPIKLLKLFKNISLILEVEEIYSDITKSDIDRLNEIAVFNKADKFIFSTILLNETINKDNKPYIISHGSYHVENKIAKRNNDGKIHCVYAGTFDPIKGGATIAISLAEYLDDKYHIHIIGFGTTKEIDDILSQIKSISKKTKCRITYDGLLKGVDYTKFIQSCDIGLSTQNPSATFNNSSFPSKVLSYLSNGLRVVTANLMVLQRSDIKDILFFYQDNDPKKIAEIILDIKIEDPYDSRFVLKELDEVFVSKFLQFLVR